MNSDAMDTGTVIEDLQREKLPELAQDLCQQGYRLVQMMGTPRKETIEVLISFDKAYQLKNYRIAVPRDDLTLPSITGSTLAAFSYENELQDLFGFTITDLAINYGGAFLRTKVVHPMADMVDPAVSKKPAAGKKSGAAKPAAAKAGEGKTIKSVPLTGVNCETAPDIDNPKPKD